MDTAGQWLSGDGGNKEGHKETCVDDEIFIILIVTMSQVYTHIKLIRLFIWNTCRSLYFDYISAKGYFMPRRRAINTKKAPLPTSQCHLDKEKEVIE